VRVSDRYLRGTRQKTQRLTQNPDLDGGRERIRQRVVMRFARVHHAVVLGRRGQFDPASDGVQF